MRVELKDVRIDIDGTHIVTSAALRAESGTMVGLIGPNGSGKSTLLRAIYRSLKPVAGSVAVGDDEVWQLSARESARRTGVVTQERPAEFDFTVREIVEMGRSPHKGMLDRDNDDDRRIVAEAIGAVSLERFADRLFDTLSGGEKQRVLVARALAQQPSVLVLDEPTNHLDIRAQLDLLELVSRLKVTTVGAYHDLNLAATYCDYLFVMQGGRLVAEGTSAEVLVPELLAEVFNVSVHCIPHPSTGRVMLAFGDRAIQRTSQPAARVTLDRAIVS